MTDQYPPAPRDQQDTAAYPRPAMGTAADGPAGHRNDASVLAERQDWYVPDSAMPMVNPEVEYWARRYRSQRTWTRALAGVVVLATLVVVGAGFAAFQAVRSNPLVSAASRLSESLGQVPDPDQALPAPGGEGAPSDGSPLVPPDSSSPDGQAAPEVSGIPLDSLPLPEDLRSAARALGIDDVEDVIALGVASGLLTEEQADQLRAAIGVGQGLQGLLGGSSAGGDA